MEASTNTPKRARTVRASHPASAFRQEPAGFSRATFGFLTDDEVEWLKARDPSEVPARGKRKPGGRGDRVIEDAPGRYVKTR